MKYCFIKPLFPPELQKLRRITMFTLVCSSNFFQTCVQARKQRGDVLTLFYSPHWRPLGVRKTTVNCDCPRPVC